MWSRKSFARKPAPGVNVSVGRQACPFHSRFTAVSLFEKAQTTSPFHSRFTAAERAACKPRAESREAERERGRECKRRGRGEGGGTRRPCPRAHIGSGSTSCSCDRRPRRRRCCSEIGHGRKRTVTLPLQDIHLCVSVCWATLIYMYLSRLSTSTARVAQCAAAVGGGPCAVGRRKTTLGWVLRVFWIHHSA